MTIPEFNRILERKITGLPTALLDIGKRQMIDAKAAIEARIKDTGINADGQPFPPYTPAYQQYKEDVGRYRGHVDLTLGTVSVNKRIAAVEKRNKRRNKVRQAFGHQGRTSLTAAEVKQLRKIRRVKAIPQGPELWANINIKHEEATPTEVKVTVAPLDDFNVIKSDNLAKKRGNFLRLNADEKANVIAGIEAGVVEFMNLEG